MKINKILSLFLIFLFIIPSFCNATDDGIMPMSYIESQLLDVKTFIQSQMLTYFSKDISNSLYFVFQDIYSLRYILVTLDGSRFYTTITLNDYDVNFKNRDVTDPFSIYAISYNDVTSVEHIATFKLANWSGTASLKSYFNDISVCTRSSFLYSNNMDFSVDTKSEYTVPECALYTEMAEKQSIIINANNNYDVTTNILTPFVIKFFDEETNEICKIMLSSEFSYWNSETLAFEIPYRYFTNYFANNVSYSCHLYLYDDADNFVYSELMFDFIYKNDSIIFDDSSTPEEPDDNKNEILGGIGDMSNTINNGLNEVNQTNKGIWESIKSIVNFLNPASEDFFVYQLIKLLGDLIKSLFVPSEEFINEWISNMNDWLSDRLGALYYPADIVVDFLTRIGDINESNTAIINIPQFKLNFMGYEAVVIPQYTYDLNSLLDNETFNNIHSIYLVVVDVILYLGLIVLAYNTFVSVFGGKFFDDVSELVNNKSKDNSNNS